MEKKEPDPKRRKGEAACAKPYIDELELEWFASECRTLKEFAEAKEIDYREFMKHACGWRKRRDEIRIISRNEEAAADEVRSALLKLWSEALYRLAKCFSGSQPALDELKRLSAIASVLKAAQTGIGGLCRLGDGDEAPPLNIEGVDVCEL